MRPARAAIENGLDIICDKPLATNLDDALDLRERVKASGLVLCQTFNYTGFPLLRQARAMVRDGDLGEIRMVNVEYVQGHNAALIRGELDDPPANWHFRRKAGRRPSLAISAAMPITWPPSSPDSLSPASWRTSPPSCRGGKLTTMPASSSASQTALRG